jgi:hypothetical protein
MCHRASILDREESAWAAGRGRLERETTKKRRLAECTSAGLLGLAEAPGKQQFEPLKAVKLLPMLLASLFVLFPLFVPRRLQLRLGPYGSLDKIEEGKRLTNCTADIVHGVFIKTLTFYLAVEICSHEAPCALLSPRFRVEAVQAELVAETYHIRPMRAICGFSRLCGQESARIVGPAPLRQYIGANDPWRVDGVWRLRDG